MIYDNNVVNISYKREIYIYVLSFLISSVVGSLSLLFTDFATVNLNKILNYTFILLLGFCVYNLIFSSEFFSQLPKNNGLTKLYPITFGQSGVTLFILSFYRIKMDKYNKWSYLGLFVGVLIVFFSSKRAPFISLVITALFLSYYLISLRKTLLTLLSISFAYLALSVQNFFRIDLIERINNSFYTESVLVKERITLLRISYYKFIDSPIFGSSMLINEEGFNSIQPHNLFVEAFMALGIVGGVLFLIFNYGLLKSIMKISKKKEFLWIAAISLQYLTQAIFSHSLYSSFFYWNFAVLVISIYIQNDYEAIS